MGNIHLAASALLSRFMDREDETGEFTATHAIAVKRILIGELSGYYIIFHSGESGTIAITPDRKANEILKSHRPAFHWSRSEGFWYVPHSRDNTFPKFNLGALAASIQAAGMPSTAIHVKSKPRSVEERIQDFRDRAAARAERYSTYGEHAAERSDAAYQRSEQASERFTDGQPILVGHHSEASARRDQARSHSAMRKSVEEAKKAEYWEGRARSAGYSAMGDRTIGRVMRRIDRLEADARGIERTLSGVGVYNQKIPSGEWKERLDAHLEDLREQIVYWRSTIETEESRPRGQNDFYVGQKFGKYIVIHVGAKSITVANPGSQYSFDKTAKMSYDRMTATTDPPREPFEWEPIEGKHPKKALIENIYKKAEYPIKIANMHGIVVWDRENQNFDCHLVILEQTDDDTLNKLAELYKVENEKPKEHADKKLIRAIYSAWRADSRSQAGGKHTVSEWHGGHAKDYVLEDISRDELLKLAWERKLRADGTPLTPEEILVGLVKNRQTGYLRQINVAHDYAYLLLKHWLETDEPFNLEALDDKHRREQWHHAGFVAPTEEEKTDVIQRAEARINQGTARHPRYDKIRGMVLTHKESATIEGVKLSWHIASAILRVLDALNEENFNKAMSVSMASMVASILKVS